MYKVIFDTNILWKPNLLKTIKEMDNYELWGVPINYVEIISHLEWDNSDSLNKVRRKLNILLDITNNNILKDPVNKFCNKHKIHRDVNFEDNLIFTARIITNSNEFKEMLLWRYDDELCCGGRLNLESFNIIKEANNNSKTILVDVVRKAFKKLHPNAANNYKIYISKLTAKEIENDIKSISSKEFKRDFITNYMKNSIGANNVNYKIIKSAEREFMRYLWKAYRGLLLYVYKRQIDFKSSDIVDIHFSSYLNQSNMIFITNDKRLLDILEYGEIPKDKFFSADKFMNMISNK